MKEYEIYAKTSVQLISLGQTLHPGGLILRLTEDEIEKNKEVIRALNLALIGKREIIKETKKELKEVKEEKKKRNSNGKWKSSKNSKYSDKKEDELIDDEISTSDEDKSKDMEE